MCCPNIPYTGWMITSTIVVALLGHPAFPRYLQDATTDTPRQLGPIDVDRIRELHRITDQLGPQIWPGFDTRKIPVAINCSDCQELLIGHPQPPAEFHPFGTHAVNGQPVLIRDGVTRYGPGGGGWAIDLGGVQTAYVCTLAADQDTDTYLALILHECFHCFQREYRESAADIHGDLPEDDPRYSALIGLESHILRAALETTDLAEMRRLAGMFVAVRTERRQGLAPNLVALEGEDEYNEGTATYSAARMYQLLAEKGGMPQTEAITDPQYRFFARAKDEYDRAIAQIVPSSDQPITFFHSMYQHGMAQCLLLDRLRPNWKEEMRVKGMTQFALIEREVALDDEARKQLCAEAQVRFEYAALLAGQTKLVEDRMNTIRGIIAAPGRAYRVYFRDLPGRFNWKPLGPVYQVPASLERELEAKRGGGQAAPGDFQRVVWGGGIRRFEQGPLVFESGDTPVVFSRDYLEWIDTTPAADRSDLVITSDSQDGETYVGATIRTDGFTLTVDRARVVWSSDVVEIRFPR